jgi:hypothetical protein
MTSTLSSPPTGARRATRRKAGGRPQADRAHSRHSRDERRERGVLARYTDEHGRSREVITREGMAGSVLVVDRDSALHGDRRLVAHLAADEPAENAALVCDRYLEEARHGRCRCRLLTPEDCRTAPFADSWEQELLAASGTPLAEPVDRRGRVYRLELLQTGMSIPELRWRRHPHQTTDAVLRPVSVREAIACLEDYEPVRTATVRAVALHRGDDGMSTTVLRAELERVRDSPIVLNRRLRETVLATIERQELSMSEVAIRCGRVKHDRAGNESGETSWLARRLGILPEGGRDTPTPWIHSDVLALIARSGLGISPREVELG